MSHSKPPSNGRPSHGSSKYAAIPTNSLFVKIKYNNTLPDLPFDPKFIVNPLSISRYVEYETTSLEHNSKHELLTPMDLGVDIDLILPERYAIPDNPVHDPEDDRLINDDEPLILSTKKSQRDKPHSQLHNKVVPWLKKTEYISTEYNRYGSSNEKTETKVGYNVRKNMKEEEIFLDKESQIRAINQTFEAAQKPLEKHPTKPDVYAKRVLPLFPDFEMWKNLFAHVKFDNEPADSSRADQMSQAIVRGAYDEELQESFVVYFLPTEVTMADRLLDQNHGLNYSEGKEYEYKSSREYTWSAKHLDNNGDDFFFVFRDDAVYYNKLTMEVTLKKRRNKSQNAQISTLVVKNREINDEEIEGQEEKLKQLMKPKPSEEPNADLTAQSLEQSYEEQAQEKKPEISLGQTDGPSSPDEEDDAQSSSPSSASSSSAASSSAASSSSSSEEESDGDNS